MTGKLREQGMATGKDGCWLLVAVCAICRFSALVRRNTRAFVVGSLVDRWAFCPRLWRRPSETLGPQLPDVPQAESGSTRSVTPFDRDRTEVRIQSHAGQGKQRWEDDG